MILAQTIKGWTIEALEGRNATHQMKKLTSDDLKAFRDRLYLPIEDKDLEDAYNPPYFHPGTDSPEYQYMMERRKQLGGSLPERRVDAEAAEAARRRRLQAAGQGRRETPVATTMALVRLFRDLMKDPEIGHRIVPIAPDEYRTFGMDSMFPTAKIYSPLGQTVRSGRPQPAAVLQGVRAGPAAARGHQRGRCDGLDDRGRTASRPTASR